MEMQEYILTALANKTVIFVTHQVEFLPAADLILVRELLYNLRSINCFTMRGLNLHSFYCKGIWYSMVTELWNSEISA